MNEWMRKQAEGMRGMTEKEQAEYLARGAAQSPLKTKEQAFEESRWMINMWPKPTHIVTVTRKPSLWQRLKSLFT